MYIILKNCIQYIIILLCKEKPIYTIFADPFLLIDQNTLASAINMYTPLQLAELETLPAGEVLFTLDVADPDSSQSHSYRYTCTPTAGEDIFELDVSK
jgi:hypothetical protein